jgi:glycosyltransferase involved in cell wall biosynthesis
LKQGTLTTNRYHDQDTASIAILMSVHNGARFISEQIDSIVSQTHSNWSLHISDDNSSDGGNRIIKSYTKQFTKKIATNDVKNNDFCKSFLQLACDKKIKSDYYAYADQDDIWDEDKLKVALEYLQTIPEGTPALYCSRTTIVDKDNQTLSFSPLFKRMPSFANALVQNIGGGNTMVFNSAAKRLLEKTGSDIKIPSHDWWTYMLVLGCGGKVLYDTNSYIRYRQHDANLVGANNSIGARLSRMKMLLEGRFKKWSNQNIAALKTIEDQLIPENRIILNQFASARSKSLFPRLIGTGKSGVYRQTTFGNIGLLVATILNKI